MSLNVHIVAPDGEVFQGRASRFRAPGVEGSFEVLTGHAPLLAAIDVGPLFVTTPEDQRIAFATSGGFVEVLDDEVTVVAETAEPAEEIDVERAKAAEQRAIEALEEEPEEAPMDRETAEQALERARNRLRVAMAEHVHS